MLVLYIHEKVMKIEGNNRQGKRTNLERMQK